MNGLARSVVRLFIGVSLVPILCVIAQGQETRPLPSITYRLSMPTPASHLFVVAIDVGMHQDSAAASLDFQMPMWSPGRYAVFDFAKNVQEFRAEATLCNTNSDGTGCQVGPVKFRRLDNQTWRVMTRGVQRLTVTYKVFGNDLSGTFSQLDTRHGNFNGGSIFMYIAGHKPDPVQLMIEPPQGWRAINGWATQPNQREWKFPNWDLMIDTPTEIGPNWTEDQFQVDGKKYRVVVHSFGSEGGKRVALVRDIERVVRAETAMWGPPEFESYTFLIHFAADDRSGDGMEHLTSTQIIQPGALADSGTYEETLDTVSHEFFHVWNVKRLRPIELGPWDFTRAVSTRGLWIAEGFTNYYGHLMLRRAGLWDDARFLKREGRTIHNIENAPGTRLMSAEDSSLSASFIDDAPHAQETNLSNTAISYYPKGELIALVLDLTIRGKTGGKASLDDVMRKMYDEFYLKSPAASYYLRGRGYTNEDFERVASEVAGFDMREFFDRCVRDVATLPYDDALGSVGLRLVRSPAREPYDAGMVISWEDPSSVIETVRNDSPAEAAGLQKGDEIISLGGRPVKRDGWLTILAKYKENDRVPIVVKRDRQNIQAVLTLGPPDRFEYSIEERPGATAEEKSLRQSWLQGGKGN